MTQLVDDLVAIIGRNQPITAVSQAISLAQSEAWTAEAQAQLVERVRLEKVVMQAYANALSLQTQQPTALMSGLLDALQADYEHRRHFTDTIMPGVRQQITQILAEAGVRFLFIKGSSLAEYPHEHRRQMNDLDLMLADWNSLFEAAAALQQHGYEFCEVSEEVPWIMRIAATGDLATQMVGHFTMVRFEGEQEIAIDLHTMPFMVGECGPLASDMWRRATGLTPTPEDKLLILIAHAANHGYFLRKDLNDAYALLRAPETLFDWDYFEACIRRSSLDFAALYALEKLESDYGLFRAPDAVKMRLARHNERWCLAGLRWISARGRQQFTWASRAQVALYTFAYEQARRGLWRGAWAAAGYGRRWLRFAILQEGLWGGVGDNEFVRHRLHVRRAWLFPEPPLGRQLFIVPATAVCDDLDEGRLAGCRQMPSPLLADRLRRARPTVAFQSVGSQTLFVRLDSAEIIITPVGIFVPTADAVFLAEELTALETLLQTVLVAAATG